MREHTYTHTNVLYILFTYHIRLTHTLIRRPITLYSKQTSRAKNAPCVNTQKFFN